MTSFKILASALALSALLLSGTAACSDAGKSDAGSSASAGSDQEQALKFAQCMRDHGVDMPDPRDGRIVTGDGGGGAPGPISGSGAVDLPVGDGTAFDACRKYLPNGGEVRKPTAAELEQQVRYAQCMRSHGLDYPDPNPDGVQQLPGILIDDTAAIQRFEEAARACDAADSPAPKQ
ncbi:hypothetical protein GCM10010399_59950 [Dactylosporangium fulvum]|uniref:Secreted protein n=1 Tax=Dactylosporangium fulvum TaxID=53359 RepID=A0ABY5VQG2_9ACTN|nr:hypothetical protein [Dactylosporangium fulvum]UWP80013.1 hypothetical protein Dfulv_33275 [Dactylosporangium fulvum]